MYKGSKSLNPIIRLKQSLDDLTKEIINTFSEKDQIKVVKHNPLWVKHINNPSDAVIIAAVNADNNDIIFESLENPSEKVQIAAVQEDGLAIKYIKNPSETVQIAAVMQDKKAIKHIKNPSTYIKLIASSNAK